MVARKRRRRRRRRKRRAAAELYYAYGRYRFTNGSRRRICIYI